MASTAHFPAATEERRTYSPSLHCVPTQAFEKLSSSYGGEILNMNHQVSLFAGGVDASILHVAAVLPAGCRRRCSRGDCGKVCFLLGSLIPPSPVGGLWTYGCLTDTRTGNWCKLYVLIKCLNALLFSVSGSFREVANPTPLKKIKYNFKSIEIELLRLSDWANVFTPTYKSQ